MKNHTEVALGGEGNIMKTVQRLFAAFFILALALEPAAATFAQEAVVVPTVTTDSALATSGAASDASAFDDDTTNIQNVPDSSTVQQTNMATPAAGTDIVTSSDKTSDNSVTANNTQTSGVQASAAQTQGDVPYYDQGKEIYGKKILAQANTNTGALSVAFPFKVPLGRNKVEPDIGLLYSSQQKDLGTIYGYGWSDTIPFIQRINKNGVEKLYSRYDFTSSFDGELLATDASSTTNFTAKVDNGDFRKYIFLNNAWQVTDKQGNVYTFGLTPVTRQDDSFDNTKVYKWMLEKVQDTNGNIVQYTYFKDNGQIYPATITYVDTGGASLYEIDFLRETRSDIAKMFATGFEVSSRYRISKVQLKVSNSVVEEYQLTYSTGNNARNSLLSQIAEVAFNSSHVETNRLTTSLSYSSSTAGWQSPIGAPHLNDRGDAGIRLEDVNGDGLVDLMESRPTMSIGFNVLNLEQYSAKNSVSINNGRGFVLDTNYSIPVTMSIGTPDNNRFDSGVRMADVNGDGLPDILSSTINCWNTVNSAVYINKGDGTGWQQNPSWTIPQPFAFSEC